MSSATNNYTIFTEKLKGANPIFFSKKSILLKTTKNLNFSGFFLLLETTLQKRLGGKLWNTVRRFFPPFLYTIIIVAAARFNQIIFNFRIKDKVKGKNMRFTLMQTPRIDKMKKIC